MPDIFISYDREDEPLARELAHKLQESGWNVWWDYHLQVGRRFDKTIDEKLDAARCVIVLWTNHAIESDWVRAEASEALRQNKVIPIAVGQVRMPVQFRDIHSVIWNENNTVEEDEFVKLQRYVKQVIGDPPVNTGAANPIPVNPVSLSEQKEKIKEKHTGELAFKNSPHTASSADEIPLSDLKNLLAEHQKAIGYSIDPYIPEDKLRNARTSCDIPHAETVLALLDLTVFGSASDCLVFTPLGIYHRWFEEFHSISYASLSATSIRPSEVFKPGFWIDDLFLNLMSSGDQVKGVVKLLNKLAATTSSDHNSDALLKIMEKYEGMGDFHVHPLIPKTKLNNAIASCAIPNEVLLALIDLTVFGAADDCLAFTATHMHYQNYLGDPKHALYTYAELSRAKIRIKRNDLMGKEVFVGDTMLNLSGTSAPLEKIIELIRKVSTAKS